ncbi:MAG: hypothetical protein LUH14_05605 [Clostridiaceae bacterium]|nr:hypothetical protein [Clostridiaceae bacterium]
MKKRIYVILVVLLLILAGIYYYAVFPAINIHETSFWGVSLLICILLSIILAMRQISDRVKKHTGNIKLKELIGIPFFSKVFLAFGVLVVLVFLIGELASSDFFRAKSYASLLEVTECNFSSDMPESSEVTDIALMDTESARILGNRKIGSLSDVVSQYEVEEDYTQIAVDKRPMKVSSLKYASFFKWYNNRNKGVPGYVKVDPVTFEAEYVALDEGMKYVPSAYFNYNLQRHVQLAYPTKIISGYHFEIDDDGNPYYICPTVTAKIGLFGGFDVNGAIFCDPVSGACEYYSTDEFPSWVDSVYSGDLLTQKYNWYGTLSDGFWNSIIGQSGCKVATDDFGYKIIEDDVWVYTGVTSVIGDQSNIGFVMMNQRTSEAKYYKVSGAEEHSAMDSAEGEVQEKGYTASFPSLVNVEGVPTYIMVLKDAAGLVKLYAMVNVEQYNIVATASSQEDVFTKYKNMLASSGKITEEAEEIQETAEAEIVVADIQFIESSGDTVVYIRSEENQIFKQPFSENESLIKIVTGDRLFVTYVEAENGIHSLQEFEIID